MPEFICMVPAEEFTRCLWVSRTWLGCHSAHLLGWSSGCWSVIGIGWIQEELWNWWFSLNTLLSVIRLVLMCTTCAFLAQCDMYQHAMFCGSCVSWLDVKVRLHQDFTTCLINFDSSWKHAGCRVSEEGGWLLKCPYSLKRVGLDKKLRGSFIPQKLYQMWYQSTRGNDDHRSSVSSQWT